MTRQTNQENEMAKGDSRQRFLVLAEKRVIKAIKAIRLVGNLANRSNYSYNHEEAGKIVKALEDEVRELKRHFKNYSSSAEIEFKL